MGEGPIITFLSILFGDVTGDETQRGLSDSCLHGKSLLARLGRFRNILAPPSDYPGNQNMDSNMNIHFKVVAVLHILSGVLGLIAAVVIFAVFGWRYYHFARRARSSHSHRNRRSVDRRLSRRAGSA